MQLLEGYMYNKAYANEAISGPKHLSKTLGICFGSCVLIHQTGTSVNPIIALYVDDITLFGPSRYLMDSTKYAEFEVMDMEDLAPQHTNRLRKLPYLTQAI